MLAKRVLLSFLLFIFISEVITKAITSKRAEKKEKILTKKFSKKYCSDLKPEGSLNDFEILHALGRGSFGVVEMVRHIKTNKFFAMKTIDLEANGWEEFEVEVRTNRSSTSAFIARMYYSFWDEPHRTTGYLVFQLVAGGDFSHFLKMYEPLPEDQVRFYAANMVMAVQYLQKRSMVHRDLKPANFLFADNGYLLLADFGLSRPMKKECKSKSLCGTYRYMAPEMLLEDHSNNEGYTKAVDWWSIGAILLELYTGKCQFWAADINGLIKNVLYKKIVFPSDISFHAKHFLQQLLQREPTQRLGYYDANDVKNHPFFKDFDWQRLNDRKIQAPYKPVFNENKKLTGYRKMGFNEHTDKVLIKKQRDQKYMNVLRETTNQLPSSAFKTAKSVFDDSEE